MSEDSATEPTPDRKSDSGLEESAREKSMSSPRGWNSSRSIAFAALAVAVVAAAAAIAAWLWPVHHNDSFSDRESASAKTSVCAAVATVRSAVFVKSPKPAPDDQLAHFAHFSNERVALLGGGAYLRETVAAEPATPADLAKAVNSVGVTLERMGLGYLARSNKAVTDSLQRDFASEMHDVNQICGTNGNK
jgi:hypothetical protein